jgi:hypothetical protein
MSEYLLAPSIKSSHYIAGEKLPRHLSSKPRQGLLHFIRCNVTVVLAFVTGTVSVGVVFWFTSWLSIQILECPHWAFDCNVSQTVKLIKKNFGLVQGM